MKLKFLNLCPILPLLYAQFSFTVPNDLFQQNDREQIKTDIKMPVSLTDQSLKNRCEQIIEASKLGHLETIKSLVKSGVNINACGDNGLTPLMISALYGRFSVMKYLISEGADVKIRAYDGSTALQLAALGQHWEIVDFLKARMPRKEEKISPFGISLPVED